MDISEINKGDFVLYNKKKYKISNIKHVRHNFTPGYVVKLHRGNEVIYEVPIDLLQKIQNK